MKTLSLWAKHHPWHARLFFVAAHFFFGFAGFEMGLMAFAKGWLMPLVAGYALTGLFILTYAIYPTRRGWYNYTRRKILDGLLLGSMCLLWIFAGNHFPQRLQLAGAGGTTVQESMLKARPEIKWNAKTLHNASARIKHYVDKRIEQRVATYKGNPGWAIAGVILLGLVLFVVVGYLGLALACSLSCAGNDAAAIVVLVLTVALEALLVWGVVRWVKHLKRTMRPT